MAIKTGNDARVVVVFGLDVAMPSSSPSPSHNPFPTTTQPTANFQPRGTQHVSRTRQKNPRNARIVGQHRESKETPLPLKARHLVFKRHATQTHTQPLGWVAVFASGAAALGRIPRCNRTSSNCRLLHLPLLSRIPPCRYTRHHTANALLCTIPSPQPDGAQYLAQIYSAGCVGGPRLGAA